MTPWSTSNRAQGHTKGMVAIEQVGAGEKWPVGCREWSGRGSSRAARVAATSAAIMFATALPLAAEHGWDES